MIVSMIRSSDPPKAHDPYAALRLPAFRRYFAGNMILILGWQMQKVAVGWEIYERTGSALYLGYVGLVQFLPQLALALFAGHVTDTYDRKHVFMVSIRFQCRGGTGTGMELRPRRLARIYVRVSAGYGRRTSVRDAGKKLVPARDCSSENFRQRGFVEYQRF